MEAWWRCGGGVVEAWWRYGGGVVEVWWRCGGGVVEVWWWRCRDGDVVVDRCIVLYAFPHMYCLGEVLRAYFNI